VVDKETDEKKRDRCRDRGKYRFTGTRYIRKGTTEERDRHQDKKE
jgi:hypothetical protein